MPTAYRAQLFRLLAGVATGLVCLLQSTPADASLAIEQWRAEAAGIRRLADNDARQAQQKAQRLQETLPADATPADRARQLNLLSRAEIHQGMSKQAGQHAEQALALATQFGDRLGQIEANLNIALNAVHLADLDALFTAPTRVLEMVDGVEHPDLLAEAMLRQSMVFRRQGKIEESVTVASQTLEIALRSQSPLAMTYAHQGMGISYDLSNRPTEARHHFSAMRNWAKQAQSTLLEGHALVGMAGQENKLGNFANSETLVREAIANFRAVGSPYSIALAKHALAEQLRERKRPSEALPLLDDAIATHTEHHNKIGLWWSLLARSSTYLDLHRLPEALADGQRTRALAGTIGLDQYLAQSARQLALIHAAQGQHQQAYQYLTEAEQIANRIADKRTSTYVVELTERYRNESRQREIDELTRRNEQQAAKERWLWTVFAACLVLLTLTALFLLRQRRSNWQLATLNRQLEQSRNRLQATYDALPDLLFELGLDGRYYDCHSPRSELLAAPVADLIGKMVADILPPEVTEICMAALHEANEQGISTGRQYALPLPHGTAWFEMSIARKTVPPGHPPRFIGLSRDISERKRSEAREEIRLRIFELLAQGGDLDDILTLVVRYMEEDRPELLSAIMLADAAGEYLHTAVAPRLPASYVAAGHTIPIGEGLGSCGTAAARRETVIIEDIYTHPLWADYKHLPLAAGLLACWSEPIVGATGAILGTLAVYLQRPGSPSCEDIERVRQASHLAAVAIERKRIEMALAASEREFRTLAENMPDFIARYDSRGRKTYLNSALIEMIGDADATQLGKTPFESLPGDIPGLAEYGGKLQRTLCTGQAESMDGVVSRGPRTGEIHNLRFVAEHAQDGSIVGAVVFSRDISELKAKERQIEESRDLLRELAARRDTAREEERKRIAREIHDELGQMLTAQRLDIATLKFQFGANNPVLDERCRHLVDIADQTIQVVRNVAASLRPAALDMGITAAIGWLAMEFENRTGIDCHLIFNEDDIDISEEESIAVFRIVQESLTNVARYAEAGQVEIALESGVDRYHLSIRDDGKGFDPDSLHGKSFGLVGIRERALLLHGEAKIVSSPGRGTAIEVSIPRTLTRSPTP